ncbi:MAG: NAD(P)-binding domain-containing protein [Candidatus Moranbacteria bacterium]|nr:NAD(P)-binding domain-containing protein [Candidatus Moranbacteria bacterium]
MKKQLSKRIAVVGSGFVGRATGKGMLQKGHKVVFFDVQAKVINNLASAGYAARHIETIAETDDDFDIFMLSVWTPTVRRHVVLRHIEAAAKEVGKALRKTTADFPLVVIRSTVPPGTIEKKLIPILEKFSGKKVTEDFGVCMNPEFLREISADEDYAHPWVVVIGADDELSGLLLGKVYEDFDAPIYHMSLKEAEMMKYVHNLLNATKISFFNEMRMVGDRLQLNSDLVFKTVLKSAEAMWNPEYGTRNFGPFSGSCLPKDTMAFLNWTSEELDFELPVLKGVIRTNDLLKGSLENDSLKKIQTLNEPKRLYSKKYSPSFANY